MSPAPFKVESDRSDGVFVIAVEGELDMNTAAELERELEGPVSTGQSPLLLDCSRCEFIDSTGIALVVRAWRALDENGGFALCGVGAQVKRVLGVTGLEGAIPAHPTREQALERLRS